jgi:putative addiction module component (TIGR02574 family)
MLPTVKSLGIDQLTRDERLAFVQEIWDTIAGEQTASLLTEQQRTELAIRAAEDNATPDDVVSWEQVKSKALQRLSEP